MNRIYKLENVIKANDKIAQKSVFYTSESTSGAVWVVKPEQEVIPHIHTTSDDLWICMQGSGVFYAEEGDGILIEKGDMVVSYKGQVHGMRNTGIEDFIFVSVVAPVPSDFIATKISN